jgi:hypothetical protein
MTIVVVFFLSNKEISIEEDNDNNVSLSSFQAKEKKGNCLLLLPSLQQNHRRK